MTLVGLSGINAHGYRIAFVRKSIAWKTLFHSVPKMEIDFMIQRMAQRIGRIAITSIVDFLNAIEKHRMRNHPYQKLAQNTMGEQNCS